MAYSDPTFVSGLATALLTTVAGYFDPNLNPAPARQVVNGLQPAWDSDQLVVWVTTARPMRVTAGKSGIRSGLIAMEAGPHEPGPIVLVVEFMVEILRHYPQIGETGAIVYDTDVPLPDPQTIDGFGAQILTDLWTVEHGLAQSVESNTVFGTPAPIAKPYSVLKPPVPLGPKADLAGWRFSLTVQGQ